MVCTDYRHEQIRKAGVTIKHIACCSFGKDSLAQILVALEHGEPLDEVIYCEVMFDENISGEQPEHINFINNIAIPYLENVGVKVTRIRSTKTYKDMFYHEITRGRHVGKLAGFPLASHCSINRDCKTRPINRYIKSLGSDVIKYIGIAVDEPKRLERLDKNSISLLAKYSITEDMAVDICKAKGLLSPIYQYADRNGCWFCPNCKDKEFKYLRVNSPRLWGELLQLEKAENRASIYFNRYCSLTDLERKFVMEDNQIKFW